MAHNPSPPNQTTPNNSLHEASSPQSPGKPWPDLPTRLFFLVFAVTFSLYFLTLAPGVVGGDAGEHQLAVPLLGIPHTTGYPLYVLVGKLWTLLIPVGSLAWRMNLFSALGGALAAGMTTLVIYHLSQETFPTVPAWAGAIVGGLTLSFGLTLWQWSTIAGVRSFNVFFFALLTLQATSWAQHQRRGQEQAAERTLRWLVLTVGLSLAHHRTTVFYLPSLVIWIWLHDRALLRHPKRLLTLTLLGLAPLSLYAFIYWRGINNPPYTHEKITNFASFWFLVGSGDSSDLFFSLDPAFLPARLTFIWHDILAQLSWFGVSLATLGAILLAWQRPAHFLLHAGLVFILLGFTLDFEVVNLNEAPTWYLMPAYLIFTVWLGLALNGILAQFPREASNPQSPIPNLQSPITNYYLPFTIYLLPTLLTLLPLALLITSLAWPNWQIQYTAAAAPLDEWRQRLRGTQARRLVESSLPYIQPHSLILGDWEQYTPFRYEQLINGQRLDLTVRIPLDRWPEKVAAAHAAGQPVYFTRKTTDLSGTPYLSMAGPLIYVGTAPNFAVPPDITALAAMFEDQLELLGYQAEVIPQPTPGGAQAGPILQVMFYWRAPRKVSWDYALSLRLIEANGQEIYRQDAAHPVLSSYPTTLWTPGEVVSDFYELPLPPNHGPLTLHLLPYRTEGAGQWHNLTLNGTSPPQEGLVLPINGK